MHAGREVTRRTPAPPHARGRALSRRWGRRSGSRRARRRGAGCSARGDRRRRPAPVGRGRMGPLPTPAGHPRPALRPAVRALVPGRVGGLRQAPREGGALMVANHAGAIPADAPSIMHGIERDLQRPVYGLADDVFKRIPLVNLGWSRLGGVQAHPDNAYRLLREQQHLVMVFPEGSKGPGKHYSERYQLRRFGRGGFVQIAMRAGVPIIPLAIVGNEETMPIVAKIPTLAKALGLPYAPITANMLLLGPLGVLLPFPAKMRIRVLDPVHLDVPPDQPRYSRSRIMDASEDIRHAIQQELYDMLSRRRSVWTG